MAGGLVPSFAGPGSVYLAVGIVGATVMPHAIYLHSALTQGQRPGPAARDRTSAERTTRWDVLLALTVAGGINAAILLGATSAHGAAAPSLTDAHTAFARSSGSFTAGAFAVALLASGLAASSVGVYSGQVVMQGFVRRSIPVWLRRAVSIAPALIVLALGVDPTSARPQSGRPVVRGAVRAVPPRAVHRRRTNHGQPRQRAPERVAAIAAGGLIVI